MPKKRADATELPELPEGIKGRQSWPREKKTFILFVEYWKSQGPLWPEGVRAMVWPLADQAMAPRWQFVEDSG